MMVFLLINGIMILIMVFLIEKISLKILFIIVMIVFIIGIIIVLVVGFFLVLFIGCIV